MSELEQGVAEYARQQDTLRNRRVTPIPAELRPDFKGKISPGKITALREQYTAEVLAKNPGNLTADEKASLWEGIEQWAQSQRK